MLQVFTVNVYVFYDPGTTFSFATPLVARKFDLLLDLHIEPFSVCTPIGDFVVANRVYRKCLVILSNRVTLAYLVELDMFDFDITWVWIDLLIVLHS